MGWFGKKSELIIIDEVAPLMPEQSVPKFTLMEIIHPGAVWDAMHAAWWIPNLGWYTEPGSTMWPAVSLND
jgi:hypothetical protein